MGTKKQKSNPKHLKHQAFVAENGFAPPGWCQIERDDSPDTEGVVRLPSDADAGMLITQAAGMPGTALWFAPGSWISFPVALNKTPTKAWWKILDAADYSVAGYEHLPRWIVLVPVEAALRAGFIDPVDAKVAQKHYT